MDLFSKFSFQIGLSYSVLEIQLQWFLFDA